MEESGNSALRIVGGVIITVLVITLAFGIYMTAKSTSSAGVEQINRLAGQMSESMYTQYEGVEITGSEVRNVLTQFKDDDVIVEVVIGSSTVDYGKNQTGVIADASKRNVGGAANPAYIAPNAKFLGSLERDANTDGITKLVFTKQ